MDINNYLNMSDKQIDNLLLGLDINDNPQKNKYICDNCGSNDLITDNIKGYIVCSNCAVINDEYLDETPDITNSDENTTTSRYGNPSSFYFPKASLGTKIVSRGYNKLDLIQKQNQIPYKEKSLMEVLDTIQKKCKKYNITQTIIDGAKSLYKKISESVHLKGKRKGKNIIMRCINRRSMIAACLFFACQLQKETRSPTELAAIYDLEIKHVNHGCKRFCDIIDCNLLFNEYNNIYDNKLTHIQSTEFTERHGKKLNIDKKYIDIAKNVSNNIYKLDLVSQHEPPSIAAGCIMLVAQYYNIPITKKEISDVFKISDVTISKAFKKIWHYHKILLSDEITNMIISQKNKLSISNNIDSNNLVITEKTNKNDNIIDENSDENIISSDSDSNSNSDSDNDLDSNSESDSENDLDNELYIKSDTKLKFNL